MLDRYIDRVIEAVKPYVTDSVWLGKAGQLRCHIALNCPDDDEVKAAADRLIAWQSDAEIKALYEKYGHDPIIKWKDSIKKVVGIDRPTEAGAGHLGGRPLKVEMTVDWNSLPNEDRPDPKP